VRAHPLGQRIRRERALREGVGDAELGGDEHELRRPVAGDVAEHRLLERGAA
jgi:hypothetical protein